MKTNATHIAARYTDTLESLQLSARDVTAIEHVTPGSRRILVYTTTRVTPIRAYDIDTPTPCGVICEDCGAECVNGGHDHVGTIHYCPNCD